MDAATVSFVQQAKRVRDYGIRAGSLPNDELIDALVPFDADPAEADPQKIAALRRAARRAFATMDEVTLDAVFHGHDPTDRPRQPPPATWWETFGRFRRPDYIVIFCGVVILLFAFHFTHWTKRAEIVLKSISEISQIDHLAEVRRMVEIGLHFDEAIQAAQQPVMRPNIFSTDVAAFVTTAETLQSYQYTRDTTIGEAQRLRFIFNPANAVRSLFLPSMVQAGPEMEMIGHAREIDLSPCRELPDQPPRVLGDYRCYTALARQINQAIGFDAGIALGTPQSAAIRQTRDALRLQADLANQWILPAIYGALGAAVYSVVRYINVFLTDPPLRTSLLRILFGAFTGITISMLFGPSSIFTMEAFVASTTLFLVCFLFGYSLDSFLALLRRADSYVNSAFTGPQR